MAVWYGILLDSTITNNKTKKYIIVKLAMFNNQENVIIFSSKKVHDSSIFPSSSRLANEVCSLRLKKIRSHG